MTLSLVATQHDGPFCDAADCQVCCLFARPDESDADFFARLRRSYGHLGNDTYGTERRSAAALKWRDS